MSLAGFGYSCALLLAGVFTLAALAKFRAPSATARSFAELGLPSPTAFARGVPIGEQAIALLLLVVPGIGGLLALVTLAFFTTFVVLRLRAGVTTPCSCFGSASTSPLSPADLVRNGFLLAAAGAALLTPAPTRPTVLDVVAVAALLGLELLVHARVQRRVEVAAG